uniref:C-type lectin domain-containing protein n=1 Tax=Crocodylus porosus TaxID=8502 RepID=A0A7M4E4X7_CROPO
MLLLETVVLLLLLSCPGLGKQLFSCLPGWYYSKTSCFRYFQSQRSWADAEAYCQSLKEGAHLPCLHEAKDLQYIAQTISYYQQTRPVWIGLNDSQKVCDNLRLLLGLWGVQEGGLMYLLCSAVPGGGFTGP